MGRVSSADDGADWVFAMGTGSTNPERHDAPSRRGGTEREDSELSPPPSTQGLELRRTPGRADGRTFHFDGSERAAGPQPIVLPGQEGLHRDRRRLLPIILGILGVAAIATVGYLWVHGGGVGSGGSTADPNLVVPPPVEQPPVTMSSSVTAQFDQRADSVLATMHRYRVRRQDFDLHRIGCDILGAGYRDVDRSFVGLSAAFMKMRASLDTAAVGRYQQLAQRADGIDHDFGATGCPRP